MNVSLTVEQANYLLKLMDDALRLRGVQESILTGPIAAEIVKAAKADQAPAPHEAVPEG